MKSIKSLGNIKGKAVIVRVDFNVPIEGGKIIDPTRILKAIPTIEYLKKKGSLVILISHSDLQKDTQTLLPVAKFLNKYTKVRFIEGVIPKSLDIKNGEVVLLENLRRFKGEKENDPKFAKSLALLGSIYVNEAFPVSHRAHASIVGIPKYLPSYIGFQFEKEIKNLSVVLNKPKRPFLFILGGAKFETKMPLIKKFLKDADRVVVTGALMNNFFKEASFEVGRSLVENGDYGIKKIINNPKLLLPVDVVVTGQDGGRLTKGIDEVGKKDKIVDIGDRAIKEFEILINKSKFVLWNGPTGEYEAGFDHGTIALLKILAKSKAKTIIGGGDTVALVSKMKMEDKFSFISTGGGATLEYLAKGTLPGIKALK